MSAKTQKTTRIEIAATAEEKELLASAADALGVSQESFVINAAMEKALEVIQGGTHGAPIHLTEEGQANLVRLLQEPLAGPTPAMMELMALARTSGRKSHGATDQGVSTGE